MAEPLKNLPLNQNLSLEFNWKCNIPSRTIRDTVVVSYEDGDETPKEEDINEIIDVDRTVDFEQPQHCTEKPRLTVSLPENENFYISRLYVVCDCKIVEVFGDHDMYIDTIHGLVVEECENFRACEFKLDMNKKINKKVSINFLKLNSPMNRLWIYGLHLTLKAINRQSQGSIRYENVEELIKDTHISDKATKCLKFLKDSMVNPQFHSARMSSPTSSGLSIPDNNTDKLVQEIKLYIDHKFQVLTEFLILRERNLHDKVDLILDYIKTQHKRNT